MSNIHFHFQVYWDTATQSWTVEPDSDNISSEGSLWDCGFHWWREADTEEEKALDAYLFMRLVDLLNATNTSTQVKEMK